MPSAARKNDTHTCPAHQGGPVAPLNGGRVETNGLAQACGTDRAECPVVPDFIVTGAATVMVKSKPAARVLDKTMHGGIVSGGSGNVVIGGPSAGVTLGNLDAAKKACAAAVAGRDPPPGAVYGPKSRLAGQQIPGHTTWQSYNNCGIESCRILINRATAAKLGEDELMDWAIDHRNAQGDKEPKDRHPSGGTTSYDREAILDEFGVESTQERQTMENITQAVAEGKGVMTSHNAGVLWDNPKYLKDTHVVIVTSVTYDANGKLVSVTTLDTGNGNCACVVPAERFDESLDSWPNEANITKQPIW